VQAPRRLPKSTFLPTPGAFLHAQDPAQTLAAKFAAMRNRVSPAPAKESCPRRSSAALRYPRLGSARLAPLMQTKNAAPPSGSPLQLRLGVRQILHPEGRSASGFERSHQGGSEDSNRGTGKIIIRAGVSFRSTVRIGLSFAAQLHCPAREAAINKTLDCRSAVVPSPSFRPLLRATYVVVWGSAGPPNAAKGKAAGEESEEAWRP
jgi:hypothetical protein